MRIWARIIIAAICTELLVFTIYILAQRYAKSVLEIIALLDFCGLMFLAGIWVTRKSHSRFLFHGAMVGVVACVLYILCCLPWILSGRLPFDYAFGTYQAFAVQIPASAAGGYISQRMRMAKHRPYGRHRRKHE
jgi:hypothetical protein